MADGLQITHKQRRRKALLGTLGIVFILAVSFCGWVYKAKTQRDLNRQLLQSVLDEDAEATRSLLKRGADPNIRNEPQQPLSLWQQIRYVFHKDSQTAQDKNATLLGMAMYSDSADTSEPVDVALIKTLLEAGARPDDCSDGHITPLMVAVQYDSPQAVWILLDHGANPLAKDDDGRHPIHFMERDDPDALTIADLLIKSGEDVNAADNFGRTALTNSCSYKNIRTIRFLIAHGADVNQGHKGSTPLSLTKSWGNKQIVRLLEAAGAKR